MPTIQQTVLSAMEELHFDISSKLTSNVRRTLAFKTGFTELQVKMCVNSLRRSSGKKHANPLTTIINKLDYSVFDFHRTKLRESEDEMSLWLRGLDFRLGSTEPQIAMTRAMAFENPYEVILTNVSLMTTFNSHLASERILLDMAQHITKNRVYAIFKTSDFKDSIRKDLLQESGVRVIDKELTPTTGLDAIPFSTQRTLLVILFRGESKWAEIDKQLKATRPNSVILSYACRIRTQNQKTFEAFGYKQVGIGGPMIIMRKDLHEESKC